MKRRVPGSEMYIIYCNDGATTIRVLMGCLKMDIIQAIRSLWYEIDISHEALEGFVERDDEEIDEARVLIERASKIISNQIN